MIKKGSDKLNKKYIKEGAIAALPVILGYLPVAIAFGLLSKNQGVSFKETGLFSSLVYAGASQFMALDLVKAGVSAGSIILATFLLNLRHVVMSASLSVKLNEVKKTFLPIIAYGITDETFSVLSFKNEKLTMPFVLTFNILASLTWVVGTLIGYLMGEIIPSSLQASLSISLYAMFAALLFPQFKIEKRTMYLSILTAIIYITIYSTKLFTSGWDIILGIIISSALGVALLNKNEEVSEN
jgi:4-azaleucine resistance transporter AzlC